MNGFKDYTSDPEQPPLSNDELLKRIDLMANTILPIMAERSQAITSSQKGKFDAKYRMIKYPPRSQVMIRDTQRNKLEPAYHGPYTIVRETRGGSYVLMDEQGLLLSRDYPPSALKLISHDEIVSLEEVQKRGKEYYVVQAIVDHKEISKGNYVYRVRWEGYEAKDDTWQEPSSFSSPKPIADYWERLGTTPNSKTLSQNRTQQSSKRQISLTTPTRQSKRLKKKHHTPTP